MSDVDVLRPTWRSRAVPLRLRSDERLARQAARGDTDAFAALYERHHRALYRYCRSIVSDPDDAADALQSTMVRALAAIGRRDERAPLRAWLFRIAHNEGISVIRARRSTEALDAGTLIGPDVEADAERRRRLAQLVNDLQALSERQRGALLMREVSGLRHAEIAAALDVSVGAVKQTIYEARTALHDFAAGREMACAAVRRELSDGDGRTARNRRLRAHLRSCESCRAFRVGLQARRSELAAIAPALPAATAAAVLQAVTGGGGAAGGGLLAGLLGGSGISKTVAVGAATVTAGAGAVTFTAVTQEVRPPDRAARARQAPAHQPGRPPAAPVVVPAPDEVEAETVEAPSPPESAPPVKRRVVAARRDAGPERRARGEEERQDEREAEDRKSRRGNDDGGFGHEGREEPEDELEESDEDDGDEAPEPVDDEESEPVFLSEPEPADEEDEPDED